MQANIKLSIGDVLIAVRSRFPLVKRPEKEKNRQEYDRFHNFLYAGKGTPHIVIDVNVGGRLPELKGWSSTFVTRHFQNNQENWRLMQKGGRAVFCCPMPDEEKVAFIGKKFSRATVHLLPKPKRGAVWELSDIVDNFLHILLINYLAAHRLGIFAHAAGIRDSDGRGLLFCGKSSAGKSTTARIWSRQSGASVLNDDRVIVRRKDKAFFLYSSPWTGEFYRNLKQNLVPARCRKIFFLYHELTNVASRVNDAQAFKLLYPTIFAPFWDRHRLENTARFCHELVKGTDCYRLGFVKNKKVIAFVRSIDRKEER